MQFPAVARGWSGALDDCLLAAQVGSPGAADVFIAEHAGWVARTVAALCRRFGVPRHEHEDVVQETYRRLLDPRLERFAPSRGDAKKYVYGVILNAIGFAGRHRRRAHEARPASDVDVPLEVVDAMWQQPFDHAEARVDLAKLMRHADPLVSRAVALMCGDGLSQRDAARGIGVSEFKLSRALAKFSARARLAA